MFPWDINPASKQPLSREYAETRIRWEPLYEITQIKGDGEAHPFLSKNDEFADFETWDKGNLNLSELKKKDMLQGEYARTALQTGLQLEQKLGVNPYKFGHIGSTDSHTSLATADDNNFWGKNTPSEPSAMRAEHPFAKAKLATIMGWETDRIRVRSGVGHGEHPRRDLGRDEAQGNLCHDRAAHDRALLRWLGFRRRRCAGERRRHDRL